MKKFLFSAIFVLMLMPLVCFGEDYAVSSKITNADVYFDQARITRKGSASVDQGVNRLLLEVKAFSLDADSVTAKVIGEGRILGVQVTRMPVVDSPRQKIKDLEDRRQHLADQRQVIEDEKKALKRQEMFLDSIVDFSKTQVSEQMQTQMPSLDQLDATRNFLGRQYGQIMEKARDAQKGLDQITRQIKQVDRELEMLRGREDKTTSAIEIMFDSQAAQSLEIEAQYMVKNAGWSPVYRAMAADEKNGVDLSMMARIRQQTGEDWNDVSLSVSTAVPVRGGRLPEISPWYLDIQKPVVRKARELRTDSLNEMALGSAQKSAAPMAEAEKHTTAVSFEYSLPMPVSIASRQDRTLLPVFTKNLNGKFYHLAVPGLTSKAYLVCEAEADSELLAGPVQIFFQGRYVGSMSFGSQSPGEPFVLGLGEDSSVKVKREKIRDHRKETAFFGKIERDSIIRELEYRLTVENLRQKPVKIYVNDRVPVSRTDRIEVKDIKLSPEPQKRDLNDGPGVMQWQMEILPQDSKQIQISFTVTYPKDMPQPAF
jgi:uncharacterized protein (TIGR02231 family)